MNKSRLILPPESMQWGRSVEEELRASKLAQSNLKTSIQGLNTQLSSVMTTVGFLSDQIKINETTPPDISSHAISLASADDNLEEVKFAFDPAYDCQLPFTTSGTGKIAYQAGGYVGVISVGYASVQSVIGLEVYTGEERIEENRIWTYWGGGALLKGQGEWHHTVMAATGQYHLAELEPNTKYLMVTFRGTTMRYNVSAGGAQQAQSYWQGASINIIKIGK